MKTISLFTGIGGLEDPENPPTICCEKDPDCKTIIRNRFPEADMSSDVRRLNPPEADLITGGWPCQDISKNGRREGLDGDKSGLFFEMIRIAVQTNAETIIGENVPNLITMRDGKEFKRVVNHFIEAGYPFVSWRTLDARVFGLPQERKRVFFVASKHTAPARALHRPIEARSDAAVEPLANGFYWHTSWPVYRRGQIPTLTASGLAPAPPAVHYDDVIRKASHEECLRLQGFDPDNFQQIEPRDVYRLAGNAVAKPVGTFAVQSARGQTVSNLPKLRVSTDDRVPSGLRTDEGTWTIDHSTRSLPKAKNLHEYIDRDADNRLSSRAAKGFLTRIARHDSSCPRRVIDLMEKHAGLSISEAAERDGIIGYERNPEQGNLLDLL